jgi:hypothetical protein
MKHALRGALAFVCALFLVLACQPSAAATRIGVNPENDAAKISRYLAFMAPQKVDSIGMIVDMASWPGATRIDWIRNILNQVTVPGQAAKGWRGPVQWTVPVILASGPASQLEQAARGDFDGYWRQLAQAILADSPPDGEILIRPMSEFNAVGWGYSWNAVGREELWKQVWVRFVGVYKSVSPRFAPVWCFVPRNANPLAAYPGDAYVAYWDIDLYYLGNYAYAGLNAEQMFEAYRTEPNSLQWIADQAKAHGKPWGISEWGVGATATSGRALAKATQDGAAGYARKAGEFFISQGAAYSYYFDRDADVYTAVSDGASPTFGAAYKAAMIAAAGAGPSVPTPTPTPAPSPTTPAGPSWNLGDTLTMAAWNRTASAFSVKPGEVAEVEFTFPTLTAAAFAGAGTAQHGFAGNTSWPGGSPWSASLRSDTGAVWLGSSLKASPGLKFAAGARVGLKIDAKAWTLAWRLNGGVYGAPLDVSAWAGQAIMPMVGVENGTGTVKLAQVAATLIPTPDPAPAPAPVPVPPVVTPPPANDNVEITVTFKGQSKTVTFGP